MAEMHEPQTENVGDLVKSLVVALNEQARAKPGILHYVNLALIVAILFYSGIFYQRVMELESWRRTQDVRLEQLKSVDLMAVQLAGMQNGQAAMQAAFSRLEERLNRYIEKSAPASR